MKYGLIVHLKTQNLGDDIQCYAMEKFLPHVDYLIDRENLDSFYTPTGEKVAAFLGGWYLKSPLNWPPSPFLKLLLISFHLTNKEGQGIFVLKNYGAEWLKKISPIGCRDEGTAEFLQSHGISAYVSGCFTLTIKPFEDVEPHGKIVLVDCPKEVVAFVKKNTNKKFVHISHRASDPRFPPEVVDYAEKHDTKIEIPTSHEPGLFDEPHVKAIYKGSWSYRRALIEGLLKFYQGASLVITNRLHVALPCLAMGVPVLMINGEQKLFHYRFSTFTQYVNHTTPEKLLAEITPEDFLVDAMYANQMATENFPLNIPLLNSTTPDELFFGKYFFDFDNPEPNPDGGGYQKFAEKIRKTCKEFITACENSADEQKVDVELWMDFHERVLRLKRILQMTMPAAYLSNLNLLNKRI